MINISLFFNGFRGLEVYRLLKRKKKIKIKNIIIAKKFLNESVLTILRKRKEKFILADKDGIHKIIKKNKKKIDINIFCGFPYIIKNDYLNLPKFGSLNLHAGKLPKYRGGSPLNWQIINGEKNIGLSVIKMKKGIDTGNIVSEKIFKLSKKDNIKSVHEKSNNLFPAMTYRSIIKLFNRDRLKKQNNKKASYFKQRNFEDGIIDWNKKNSSQIFNFVRALTFPYHNAYTLIKKKIFFIKECSEFKKKLNIKHSSEFLIRGNFIFVKTKKNYIKFYNKDLCKFAKKRKIFKFDNYVA